MARIAPLALALVCISGVAAADVPLVGAWFGPRIFANNSTLGYINDAPEHPMLETSIELGVRISHDFIVPWLYPEFELGFSPTHTTPTGAPSVSVALARSAVQPAVRGAAPRQATAVRADRRWYADRAVASADDL